MKRKIPNPLNFMLLSQDEVLDNFHNVPGAYSDGTGQERFVFIPGTRPDRVIMVAHADTVFGEESVSIGFNDGVFYSKNRSFSYKKKSGKVHREVCKGTGIGADDRAGCAIVWELLRTGHSALITSGEEDGCIGSRVLSKDPYWDSIINDEHQFAVQFDRRGKEDLVFYDVGQKDFVKYAEEQTGYKRAIGSFTDICVLCNKICGVNMSVGYYFEHGTDEKLEYSQWLNTLHTAYTWLSRPNLPKFLQEVQEDLPVTKYKSHQGVLDIFQSDEKLRCHKCGNIFEMQDFLRAKHQCPICGCRHVEMFPEE